MSDKRTWMLVSVQMCGVMILIICVLVLFGYLLEIDGFEDWQSDHTKGGMAIPTAVCFIAIGICLIILPNAFKTICKPDGR